MKANRSHFDASTGIIPAAALELAGMKEKGRFQERVAVSYSANPRTVLRDRLGITWAALDQLGLDRAAPAKATLAALDAGDTDVAAVVEGRWHPPVVARTKKVATPAAPVTAISAAWAEAASVRAEQWMAWMPKKVEEAPVQEAPKPTRAPRRSRAKAAA